MQNCSKSKRRQRYNSENTSHKCVRRRRFIKPGLKLRPLSAAFQEASLASEPLGRGWGLRRPALSLRGRHGVEGCAAFQEGRRHFIDERLAKPKEGLTPLQAR